MDYYRRYVGDYLKKTTSLNMIEDGAYTRLLDAYYGDDGPLDPAKVNATARATNAAERKAVADVVRKFFYLGEDGLLHNEKADEELAVALPKIEKQRETARENGKKGGRPKKPNQVLKENPPGSPTKPELVPTRDVKQPPTASPKPDSKPPSEERFPGRDTTPGTAAALGAAALRHLQPPGPEADVRTADETPAGMLAAVCQRNGIQAHAFHPLIVEWAREGRTVEQIKAAIATARQPQRKGDGHIPLAYLDRILGDDNKPKPVPWKTDDAEARKLCAQLGIKPDKVGESRDAWHRRIETALAEQSRSRVA